MGRQVSIKNHCLFCLKELDNFQRNSTAKWVYERQDPGFSQIGRMCRDCAGYLRGGNWPTDVYAKLSGGREEPVGKRAVEALVAA